MGIGKKVGPVGKTFVINKLLTDFAPPYRGLDYSFTVFVVLVLPVEDKVMRQKLIHKKYR